MKTNPDHIDPDEGRPDPEPFYAHAEPCENCGNPCFEARIWIEGFNYWACENCAQEAAIVVFAEANCPTLYDFVMRSESVSEVQKAYREHERDLPELPEDCTEGGEVARNSGRGEGSMTRTGCTDCGGELNYALDGVIQPICYECAHPRRYRRKTRTNYNARKFWEICVATSIPSEGASAAIRRADEAVEAWKARWDKPEDSEDV